MCTFIQITMSRAWDFYFILFIIKAVPSRNMRTKMFHCGDPELGAAERTSILDKGFCYYKGYVKIRVKLFYSWVTHKNTTKMMPPIAGTL